MTHGLGDARSPNRAGSGALVAALACGALALIFGSGCAPGVPLQVPEPELTEGARQVYARRQLVIARSLHEDERLESALRATSRGLRFEPDNAKLHRLRAQILEEMGRADEAAPHRERADALSPEEPLLPEVPIRLADAPLPILIILLPPPAAGDPDHPWAEGRLPESWPDGEAKEALVERLNQRLPGGPPLVLSRSDVETHVTTVPKVRRWLESHRRPVAISLRLDRAFCGESAKDGAYSVVWLRAALARGDRAPLPAQRVETVVEDPGSCRAEAVARALEEVLALPQIRERLAGTDATPDAGWSNAEIRRLFPSLQHRIDREIEAGRKRLEKGELAEAAAHLRRAQEIDPLNESTNSLLLDIETSIAISRELSERAAAERDEDARQSRDDAERLLTTFTPAERQRAEQRLVDEERQRDHLMATIEAHDDTHPAATAAMLDAMTISPPSSQDSLGTQLARARSDEELEVRSLHGPEGDVIARYYFGRRSNVLLLREADDDRNGQPDRWVAYQGTDRSEVWQDDQGGPFPRLHMVFGQGGGPLETLEIDDDRNGHANQIYRYRDGQIETASRDTSGDGRYDRVEHFDRDGGILFVDEDLDGDGQVDIRTHYRAGRLVRREFLSHEVFESTRTSKAAIEPEGDRAIGASLIPGSRTRQ